MSIFEWLQHDFLEFSDFWKIVGLYFFQKLAKKNGVWKHPVLPGSKFPLLAIHKIISHIWEDGSQKVNNGEPNLRFFHGNFWPLLAGRFENLVFSTSIPRGPNLCILDFQTPPAPPDEFSNPDPGPSQRTQGWNTSARKPSLLIYCFEEYSGIMLGQNDPIIVTPRSEHSELTILDSWILCWIPVSYTHLTLPTILLV